MILFYQKFICELVPRKYMKDLKLMRDYYYTNFINKDFYKEQARHLESYKKNNGIVFGGKYIDS